MTKIRTVFLLVWMIALFGGNDLFSQGEQALLTQQKDDLEAAFVRQHGNMTHLITGRQHYAYYAAISGNPFWPSDIWVYGSLQTKQFFYGNIALKYDAHLDAVVFLPDSFSLRHIWVNPELVDYFSFHGKTFLHMGFGTERAAMESAGINPGYFELAYKGKSLLLIKRSKFIKSTNTNTQSLGEFIEKSFRYALIGEQLFPIKSKKDLRKAFRNHESEIKSFMKMSKYKIRMMTDQQFINLLTYYDSL